MMITMNAVIPITRSRINEIYTFFDPGNELGSSIIEINVFSDMIVEL